MSQDFVTAKHPLKHLAQHDDVRITHADQKMHHDDGVDALTA